MPSFAQQPIECFLAQRQLASREAISSSVPACFLYILLCSSGGDPRGKAIAYALWGVLDLS